MKKILLAAIIGLVPHNVLAADTQTHILSNFYVAGKFIYGYQRVENIRVSVNSMPQYNRDLTDRTTGGAIALGYNFVDHINLPLRVEFEAAKRNKFKTEGAKINTDTYLINAYYDFTNETPFTPYLSAGMGSSKVDLKISNSSFTRSDAARNFSWNVGAGVSYELSKNISADVGYRFIDYGNVNFSRNLSDTDKLRVKADQMSHEVLMGLRYTF